MNYGIEPTLWLVLACAMQVLIICGLFCGVMMMINLMELKIASCFMIKQLSSWSIKIMAVVSAIAMLTIGGLVIVSVVYY